MNLPITRDSVPMMLRDEVKTIELMTILQRYEGLPFTKEYTDIFIEKIKRLVSEGASVSLIAKGFIWNAVMSAVSSWPEQVHRCILSMPGVAVNMKSKGDDSRPSKSPLQLAIQYKRRKASRALLERPEIIVDLDEKEMADLLTLILIDFGPYRDIYMLLIHRRPDSVHVKNVYNRCLRHCAPRRQYLVVETLLVPRSIKRLSRRSVLGLLPIEDIHLILIALYGSAKYILMSPTHY
jgi:hypothetical protein